MGYDQEYMELDPEGKGAINRKFGGTGCTSIGEFKSAYGLQSDVHYPSQESFVAMQEVIAELAAAISNVTTRKTVEKLPFKNNTEVHPNDVDVVVLHSGFFSSSKVAIGSESNTSGGLVAASVVGAVFGQASIAQIEDIYGKCINAVRLQLVDFGGEVKIAGNTVYGLVQAAQSASDGDAIGAQGQENIQVTFVVWDKVKGWTPVKITAKINFTQNVLAIADKIEGISLVGNEVFSEANSKVILKQFALKCVQAGVMSGKTISIDFDANFELDGTSFGLGESAFDFNENTSLMVEYDGRYLIKGENILYVNNKAFYLTQDALTNPMVLGKRISFTKL